MRDGVAKGLLAGQLPARCQVARRIALDHQHAERTFVHLHVQAAARRGAGGHAQHVLGVALPVAEIADLGNEITQSTDVDHAPAPEMVVS
ncbi:hypothetical protein D3C72_2173370 [compost metagenome]